MYSLRFRPLANNDIQEIVDYYDSLNPQLSEVFLKELGEIVKHIQNMPKSYQKKLGDIRVAFLVRFSYGVYFKIYDREISIIAILHTGRNPKIWKKR